MTVDESIEKACELLSEEEANELLKSIANDDVVLPVKMILRCIMQLPKEDIITLIDEALDDDEIIDMLKTHVHFPDYLREEAKEQLEELNSKEA